MVRTDERQAAEDLGEALRGLGLGLQVELGGSGAELVIQLPGGGTLAVEVKSLRGVSAADAARLTRSEQGSPGTAVVVADRVVPAARSALQQAGWGWLDRRGHLRLAAPGVAIDTEVRSMIDSGAQPKRPALDTDVGLDVAVAVLTDPTARWSIRRLVTFTGRSLGSVHQARRSLGEEGLLGRDGTPLTPELFWEISGRWRPVRVPLGQRPSPGDTHRSRQLGFGLEDTGEPVGWALTDTLAANAFGARSVVRGDYPPDFYVPDQRNLRIARQLYGDPATASARAATVALCPASWVCRRRVDPASIRADHPLSGFGWVPPVVAALDLSIDVSRGREILEEWTPPPPWVRVW